MLMNENIKIWWGVNFGENFKIWWVLILAKISKFGGVLILAGKLFPPKIGLKQGQIWPKKGPEKEPVLAAGKNFNSKIWPKTGQYLAKKGARNGARFGLKRGQKWSQI